MYKIGHQIAVPGFCWLFHGKGRILSQNCLIKCPVLSSFVQLNES